VSMGMGSGATVTYAALQLAYHMGANPVIIVGVDHSFDKSGSANIYEKRSGADNNHFDPNYFKDGSYWGVPNLDASEEVFLKSRIAFEQDGRKIYDATVDGKLQIFEKIAIDDAVALIENVSEKTDVVPKQSDGIGNNLDAGLTIKTASA
ncbi:MAG: hypothetical protein AB8B54_01370, partial [Sphingorhabdus sp.]